jgi:glycosyltransferase involved in cell wall biosynthesis
MTGGRSARRVLIAHQSTIPHYRAPFYRAVEQLRPAAWQFAVVDDLEPGRRRRIYAEPAIDRAELGFEVEPVSTLTLPGSGSSVRYQTFFRRARHYDLIVLEDALHNLTYPLIRLQGAPRRRLAYWGHGRDLTALAPGLGKRLLEKLKLQWIRRAAGYFAYTEGVRSFLVEHGVDPGRIFVLHNTIDIESHRRHFLQLRGERERLRRERGWQDRRVLLFVGRVNPLKRLEYLAEAVAALRRRDSSYLLAAIGGGEPAILRRVRAVLGDEGFEPLGIQTEPAELAPIFTMSDAYVLPGLVGLGPLMALCYDLTPVIVESPTHSPEVEYLSSENAVILPVETPAEGYAMGIAALLENTARASRLKAAAWPSIQHLTIHGMAQSFVSGIDALLARCPERT